jgi:type I restriction enzyme M protein
MPDHNYFANLIWQIADLLRGPYRPPQYECVMLPMTVLRRFDCVLAPTKVKVRDRFTTFFGNGSMPSNGTRNKGSFDDR